MRFKTFLPLSQISAIVFMAFIITVVKICSGEADVSERDNMCLDYLHIAGVIFLRKKA